MTMFKTDVLIIGAGVSGITTALSLLDAGVPASSLRLIADRPPALTTSSSAGAIWGLFLSPTDQGGREWGRYTLHRLNDLAGVPDTGISLVRGVLATRAVDEPPDWVKEVQDFRLCTPDELPAEFVSGWRYTVPVIDMPVYLRYLHKRLAQAGVTVEIGRFASLGEATAKAPIVVNCTGLGARRLVPDDTMRPVRGQLVVVENPGITEFFDEYIDGVPELTYLLPMGDRVVLGGSAEDGVAECSVDPRVAERILKRCAVVAPRLRDVKVLGHRVGLRPMRPTVRLEREDIRGVPVVHNYGHGGSGVSLSWGCAHAVTRLVLAV